MSEATLHSDTWWQNQILASRFILFHYQPTHFWTSALLHQILIEFPLKPFPKNTKSNPSQTKRSFPRCRFHTALKLALNTSHKSFLWKSTNQFIPSQVQNWHPLGDKNYWAACGKIWLVKMAIHSFFMGTLVRRYLYFKWDRLNDLTSKNLSPSLCYPVNKGSRLP